MEETMKKNSVILGVILLLIASTVFAQPGPHGRKPGGHCGGFGDGPGGHGMLLRFADEIGLEENQQAEIAELMEQNSMERIDKQAELKKARVTLRHLQLGDASEAEVLRAMEQVGDLRTDLQKMKYQHRNQIKSVLTDAQLEKLEDLKEELGPRDRQQRGDWGPGHKLGGRGHFGFGRDGN
jgi:Spy/CpxP family protein refolding chaperone